MYNITRLDDNNFAKILENNTIETLRRYAKTHPDELKDIAQRALLFLQNQNLNISTNSTINDLKLKAWFLVPNELNISKHRTAKVVDNISFINLSKEIRNELKNNIFNPTEKWRLNEIASRDLHLSSKDSSNKLRQEVTKANPDLEIVRFLLENGADLTQIDRDHNTVLHLALSSPSPNNELISLLIEFGADCRKTNLKGDTPLHVAAKNPLIGIEVYEKLVSAGGDVDRQNDIGQIPLHQAILASPPNFDAIGFLTLLQDNVNTPDENGDTPLHYTVKMASETDSAGTIELLCSFGGNINAKNKDGHAPLHSAVSVESPSLKVVQRMIENGSDLSLQDNVGNTPLHSALYTNPSHEAIVKHMLEKGASIRILNKFNVSCRSLIAYSISNSTQIMKFVEQLSQKTLAASWGISGTIPIEGIERPLEEGFGEIGELHILRLFELFVKHPSQTEELSEVLELYKTSITNGKVPFSVFKKKFDQGEPFSFVTGWKRHTIEVMFYKDYLMISNRGEHRKKSSVKVYKMERDAEMFLERDFRILKDEEELETSDEGKWYFYKTLPRLVGYDKSSPDMIAEAFNWESRHKGQKVGNCWWVNPKAGVFALMAMHLIDRSIAESKKMEVEFEPQPSEGSEPPLESESIGFEWENLLKDLESGKFARELKEEIQMRETSSGDSDPELMEQSATEDSDSDFMEESTIDEMEEWTTTIQEHKEKENLYKSHLDQAERTYKKFSEFTRIQFLKEYLQNINPEMQPNPDLIRRIEKKLNEKDWKYVFQNNVFITKEEIFQLIRNYQKTYRLDEHFNPKS